MKRVERTVAIPSSSGLFFQLTALIWSLIVIGVCRNPFFIRSLLPTKKLDIYEIDGTGRNPFFIRSLLPTGETGGKEEGETGRNPFFIRSLLPTAALLSARLSLIAYGLC